MARIRIVYRTGRVFVTEPMPRWEALDYLREARETGLTDLCEISIVDR